MPNDDNSLVVMFCNCLISRVVSNTDHKVVIFQCYFRESRPITQSIPDSLYLSPVNVYCLVNNCCVIVYPIA